MLLELPIAWEGLGEWLAGEFNANQRGVVAQAARFLADLQARLIALRCCRRACHRG